MWLVQSGDLLEVQTDTNPFTYPLIGSSTIGNYNGADFNPADNFIYGIGAGGTPNHSNHLYRINATGSATNLGVVAGLPINGNYRSGAFSPAGNILYLVGHNFNDRLYLVNITTQTASFVTLSRATDIADIAWFDDMLYAVEPDGQTIRIDPASGAVTNVGAPSAPTSGYFGALFGASNGFFGSHNSGGFYQISTTTGTKTLLSDSPASTNNDGMHCPSAPLAFGAEIAVSKTSALLTYTPGAQSEFTVIVQNEGPFGAQGVAVFDPVPAGIPAGAVNWTCEPSNGAACAASGTGAIDTTVDLPFSGGTGGIATFTITIDVPSDFTDDLTNAVQITPPDSVTGDDPTNNFDSVTLVSVPRLTLEKAVINDDGGTLAPEDFTLTASGPIAISGVMGDPSITEAPVPAGVYTLGEAAVPGYTAGPYSCVVDGGAPVSGNSITLDNEQVAVCTITNDDEPGTLTLRKTVVNNSGGTSTPDDFTLTATGPVTVSGVTGDAAITDVIVPAGTYALSETSVPGYSEGTFRCSIDGAGAVSSNTLDLPNGAAAICTITNDDIAPQVSLSKALVGESGSVDDFPEPGEILTYEITLTNTGGQASDFEVVDVLDDNVALVSTNPPHTGHVGNEVTWSGLTVPAHDGTDPGELVLTIEVEVDSGLAPGSEVRNLVREPGEPDPPCPSDQCVVIPPLPSVSIEKDLVSESGSLAGVAEPGERLVYAITLTNLGSQANDYDVRDLLDDNLVFVLADGGGVHSGEANGGQIDWTGLTVPAAAGGVPGTLVLEVEADVLDPLPVGVSSIANVAYDPLEPVPDCPSDQCVTMPAPGQISIAKALVAESGAIVDMAEPGEELTYEITLTNTGGIADDYSVEDVLDPNTGFVSADNGGVHDSGVVTWSNLTVPAHDGTNPGELVLTVVAQVDDPLPPGVAEISNFARVPGDPEPPCPSDQCATIPAIPQIAIEKALVAESGAIDGMAEPGEELTYEITLTNTGGIADDYSVEDILDANTTYLNSDQGGQLSGGSVIWSDLTIPAHDGVDPGVLVLTITVEVDAPLPTGVSTIANIARETGTPEPPCPSDQCVTMPTPGQISIAKALVAESGAIVDIAEPGEELTYEITLTNTGGIADDYSVEDVLDPNTGFVSADNGGVHDSGVVTWSNLTVPAHDGTNPGELVLTVVAQVDDPLPPGVAEISNFARVPGDPEPPCPSDQCATIPAVEIMLVLEKQGTLDTAVPGTVTSGDAIDYVFTVRNESNVALADVSITDPGPSFDGHAGEGTLSAISPNMISLAPDEEGEFTARYTLVQADIDNAAGIADAVSNTAQAVGYWGGNEVSGSPVPSNQSTVLLQLPAVGTEISIAKQALVSQILRGQEAPFAILVINSGAGLATGLMVIDTLPSGFRFVEGSATVDGIGVTPVVEGRTLRFEGLSIAAGATLRIELRMLALSTATPGRHVNRAVVTDDTGTPIAPEATAEIEIMAEGVFDCSDIIGRVFDDRNRNGYQDPGEPGLPGVRLATVNGVLITTDAYGRFHVPCAAMPDQRIGANFVLKLDERSLPTGYSLTTENPRVIRVTAGKVSMITFGAALGREVRLDLSGAAFGSGSVALQPEWHAGLEQLIDVLLSEPTRLVLAYQAGSGDALARQRLTGVADTVRVLWQRAGAPYQLDIDMRIQEGH